MGIYMNPLIKKTTLLFFIILTSFSLSACKKEEQGRPLKYNKGEYGGSIDEKLNYDKVKTLQQRTIGQSWY